MSKVLNGLMKRHPDKIHEWYHDSDGYWIDFKSGWSIDQVHGVHEDTVKDSLIQFGRVERCECEDCVKDLATALPVVSKAHHKGD